MSNIPNREITDTEVRLIVLYILKCISPCTELSIIHFSSQYNFVNYFDLMESLINMRENGHAVRSPHELSWIYEITPSGNELLEMFENRIPHSTRTSILEKVPAWLDLQRRERERLSSVKQTPLGDYEITLSIKEQNGELMRSSLALPSLEMANTLSAEWKKKAGDVYQLIIDLLKEA